ncbi:MAG TPA: hydroxymethylbilane synthase [Gemmatimonadales bacterium]|nr:hydroxymethylbilane synthase [Gemmatimonadales bacterium]
MTAGLVTLRAGTRASALARWQTGRVSDALERLTGIPSRPIVIQTTGDRALDIPLPALGGKGAFTEELEGALREGRIDFAVHSLKDLPVDDAPGITVAAILSRDDARDVVIARNGTSLAGLPAGAVVGTSSNRRLAQIASVRPDLVIRPLRGNVDSRVKKALDGEYDAIVIAAAGVARLGLTEHVTEYLSFERMLPAPGQGALAVQCRADDDAVRALLMVLDDPAARIPTTAERAFLSALGGGCAAPIAALGESFEGEGRRRLRLSGLVASLDGRQVVRASAEGEWNGGPALAQDLADRVTILGGRALLR